MSGLEGILEGISSNFDIAARRPDAEGIPGVPRTW